MRAFVIALVLFAVCVGFVWIAADRLQTEINCFQQDLRLFIQTADMRESYDSGYGIFLTEVKRDDLLEKFNAFKNGWYCFLPHKELEHIEETLMKLSYYTDTRQPQKACVKALGALQALRRITEKEQVSVSNLF